MKKEIPLVKYFIIALILALFFLYMFRTLSARQIDDVNPIISCDKEQKEVSKSEFLFIIPKFQNISIADNLTWCKKILSLNKTLGMHGVYHTYNEFNETRSLEYIQEGKEIFKECFGYYPVYFKPPQMEINKENKIIIKQSGMILISQTNQVFHKCYHCSDTGYYSNRMMDWF